MMGMTAPPQSASADKEPPLRRPDGTPTRVLRYEGWEIRTAGEGLAAVRTAREFRPDAVVLDVMLPDLSGLEVLGRLRAELPHVCVLFLTARDAVEDRVAGITAGGDDYVTKPFSLEEVLARLRGLLRRAGCCPRRRSWTGCGVTTSAGRRMSSSCTSATCGRRSTPGVSR